MILCEFVFVFHLGSPVRDVLCQGPNRHISPPPPLSPHSPASHSLRATPRLGDCMPPSSCSLRRHFPSPPSCVMAKATCVRLIGFSHSPRFGQAPLATVLLLSAQIGNGEDFCLMIFLYY